MGRPGWTDMVLRDLWLDRHFHYAWEYCLYLLWEVLQGSCCREISPFQRPQTWSSVTGQIQIYTYIKL